MYEILRNMAAWEAEVPEGRKRSCVALLCLKKSWSSEIICLFLLMAKAGYLFDLVSTR